MELTQKTKKEKTITIGKNIDKDLATSVIKAIYDINKDDEEFLSNIEKFERENNCNVTNLSLKPITILLNTYGGCIYDGLGICDAISDSKTPVEIICSGYVMSMGIGILLSSDVRKAHKNTTFMIHQPSELFFGTMQDMEEDLNEMKRLNNVLVSKMLSCTKITQEMVDDYTEKKKDWFLTAEEALELGVITEII